MECVLHVGQLLQNKIFRYGDTELIKNQLCIPSGGRTHDLPLRRRALYPLSYRDCVGQEAQLLLSIFCGYALDGCVEPEGF